MLNTLSRRVCTFARCCHPGRWVAMGLLAAHCASAQAPVDVRVALVIGNSAYPGAPLLNPANDARAMSETLKAMGFNVVELRDARKEQMAQAIAKVRDALQGRHGVGMLYYAGHGLQLDWRNYMVPVDARLARAVDVPDQTVDINSVIDSFKVAGNRMNILVLDACRDNPFSGSATGKGLAQLDAPPGTFLAYATAPGNVAEDGEAQGADGQGGNGLYTRYLLEELKKPVAKIEDVFKRVRLQVRQKSQGRQIPWESTSLEDDFYFQQGPVRVATEAEQDAAVAQDLQAWTQARTLNQANAYVAYLQQFPTGRFSELAQSRLDQLSAPLVRPQFRPGDALAHDTRTERFRLGDRYEYAVRHTIPPQAEERNVFRVTAMQDDSVKMNEGGWMLDRLGNIQVRGGHAWDEAQFFPADYQVGKKWKLRMHLETDNYEEDVDLDARIVAREKITVGAGAFEVFRLQINGFGGSRRRYAWTYWMHPRYGMPIQWTEERYNPRGKVRRLRRFELMALRAPRD